MQSDAVVLIGILGATVLFLVFEFVRIDVAAMLCMLALGWSRILTPGEMLSGFSSDAVIVMMAVMVMGRGIDKAGIMDRFSDFVLKNVQQDKKKIIIWLSIAVALLSAFIQNIGAIALFLPGIIGIARRSKIPASELIMPIGFAAILGGTLTIVASGPLLLVNDLLNNANLAPYGMFSVTPIGILLLLSGLAYFLWFGKKVLPQQKPHQTSFSDQEKLIERLNLPNHKWNLIIKGESPFVGKTAEESVLIQNPSVHILAMMKDGELEYAPWRKTVFKPGQEIVVLGTEEDVNAFAQENRLAEPELTSKFEDIFNPEKSGFAEVIIPGVSELAGKTIRDYQIRKRFAVEPILLFSQGREIRGDISDHEIQPGDKIIVYGIWDRINALKDSIDFVVASSFETEGKKRPIRWSAVICFGAAVGLALSGFSVALSFFSSAVAMVLTRNLTIEEMYQAIEWRVVFLLAGLIPLGIAMQKTGTAVIFAEYLISTVLGGPLIFTVIAVGILATIFSLFISNVGAIVVLTPVIVEMAAIGGFDPRPMVLLAAVCAANSFIIPTHQVNAFIISPGGYSNADYFKAGIWMTLIFLFVTVPYFYFFML